MIDVEKITERCKGCRYNHRSVLDEPCRSGIYMIHYSGNCLAYKPSLWYTIKGLIRKVLR